MGPRTGSPPRALPLGRSERLLGARPVRWPLRDQVSASSSSASVPMVPGTRTPAAVVSLTPMCRLLLPGFRSSRWAKSASFGSAEATVAHRRPPSPPASPACPPSPPRVGGTPQVRAPVCRAPGPLSLYHLASAQPISPPPMSLWGKVNNSETIGQNLELKAGACSTNRDVWLKWLAFRASSEGKSFHLYHFFPLDHPKP